MEVVKEGLDIEIEGEGEKDLPRDETNLIAQSAEEVFRRIGKKPSGLRIRATNRIPLSSGLGSSAAAVVAAVAAANILVDGGLSNDDLLSVAVRIEGHADNAAASMFGGLNLVRADGDVVVSRQVEIPELRVALAHPDFGLSTKQMRQVLPGEVPLEDAAFNLGSALLSVEALRSGDYSLLAQVMEDRLHQPTRAGHIPGYTRVTESARSAGAAGVALSGAGPSLVAFGPSGHEKIARAMVEAWADEGVNSRGFVLSAARRGVTRE
jgi:homoserine kinase